MQLFKWLLLVAGIGVVGCGFESDGLAEDTSEATGPRARYVVTYRSAQAPANASAKIAQAGGTPRRVLTKVGVAVFDGTAEAAAKLAKDPTVESVGKEHVYRLPSIRKPVEQPVAGPVPPDYFWFYQWDQRRVGAPAVWARNVPVTRPRVAVLDTGVALDHPDLWGQIGEDRNYSYCPSTGSWPSVGYPVYNRLVDFTIAQPDCVDADLRFQSHGTHVAGTIGGNWGGGVVGVAPNADIGAFRVFDRYRAYNWDGSLIDDYGAGDGALFQAIIDAADAGYPVISMSLGGTFDIRDGRATWNAWKRVSNYAFSRGSLIVAALGNSQLDLSGTLANVPSDLPNVLGVAATGTSQLVWNDTTQTLDAAPGSDVLAEYSNFGAPADIAAPGGDCGPLFSTTGQCFPEHLIFSSYIFEMDSWAQDFEGNPVFVPAGAMGWAWFAGTSMATPHVAAVAGQVAALRPALGAGGVSGWLTQTATPIGPASQFGAGMLNADAAVR